MIGMQAMTPTLAKAAMCQRLRKIERRARLMSIVLRMTFLTLNSNLSCLSLFGQSRRFINQLGELRPELNCPGGTSACPIWPERGMPEHGGLVKSAQKRRR